MSMKTSVLALALAASLGAAPAIAQNTNVDVGGGQGLVVVDIGTVAQDIANDLNVEVSDVIDIGSVQLPINVAATVCNIDVNAIASSNDRGSKSCTATATSEALNQAVLKSIQG